MATRNNLNRNTVTGYEGMTGQHIAAYARDYEAARSAFFEFVADIPAGILKASVDTNSEVNPEADSVGVQASAHLRINVVKANIPHFNVEVKEYRRGNEVVKFAGTPTFDEGEIVVDDVVGLGTKDIVLAWQALTYDVHTRKGGRMADWTDEDGVTHYGYKRDCELLEYTQDYVLVRKWHLYGCWISQVSEGQLDKEADDKRQITATIIYDRAELIMDSMEPVND